MEGTSNPGRETNEESAIADLEPGLRFAPPGDGIERILEALSEAQNRFHAFIDMAPDAIFIADAKGRLTEVNRAACRELGYTPEQLLRLSVTDIVPARLAAEVAACLAIEEGAVLSFESWHAAKDGTEIPVEISIRRLTLAGKPAFMGISRNITERRRAEEALRRSEQLNREVINGAQVGVLVYDRQFRYQVWNPFMEELTGMPAAEVLGRCGLDLFPFLHEQHVNEMHDRALRGETVRAPDTLFRIPRTGRSGWTSATYCPHFGSNGEIIGVIGLINDITERRKTEEALRLSEERQRLAMEAAREGLWDWDLPGDSAYVSPRYAAILGYEPGEFPVSHKAWRERVHPDDLPALLESMPNCLGHSQESFQAEYRMRHKSGRFIWVESHGRVISRAADGSAMRVMGTVSDITERKSVQEQLIQAQKMESVGRLAGGIAHDFNNLLTVINGYGDLLLRKLNEGDPLLAWAAEIREAGKRAVAVTSRLLAFSRKRHAELRPIDLNRLIGENQAMLQRLIGEDIELVTQLDAFPGVVMADSGEIHQVLMNLVANARDAMPSGGILTIRTADNPIGPFVSLAVSDTGVGIEKDIQSRIFDPFFTTKGDGEGTGLGISAVYGIVRHCGGSIAVRSEPGSGATFEIRLPRAQETIPADAGAGSRGGEPRGSETILVVEDREPVRRFVVTVLKQRGYQVLAAAHGGEALNVAERHPGTIHLLLTDLEMPHMTGRELAMRMGPLRPELKVLCMSGYPGDIIARRGLLDPGVPYIAKPFTPEALAEKVRKVLGGVRDGDDSCSR